MAQFKLDQRIICLSPLKSVHISHSSHGEEWKGRGLDSMEDGGVKEEGGRGLTDVHHHHHHSHSMPRCSQLMAHSRPAVSSLRPWGATKAGEQSLEHKENKEELGGEGRRDPPRSLCSYSRFLPGSWRELFLAPWVRRCLKRCPGQPFETGPVVKATLITSTWQECKWTIIMDNYG